MTDMFAPRADPLPQTPFDQIPFDIWWHAVKDPLRVAAVSMLCDRNMKANPYVSRMTLAGMIFLLNLIEVRFKEN